MPALLYVFSIPSFQNAPSACSATDEFLDVMPGTRPERALLERKRVKRLGPEPLILSERH